MKSTNVTVRLSREDTTYNAGESIDGIICIDTQQDVKLKGLTLRLYGYGRVCWDEKRAYIHGASGRVEMKNIEVYLDQSISLLRKGVLSLSMQNSSSNSTLPRSQSELRRFSSRALVDMFVPTSSSSGTTDAAASSVPSDDDPVTLPPGTHQFPFEFVLPASLPGSYQGRWGQVAYSARICLERAGWVLADQIEREQEFLVRAAYDLNDEPELVRPVGAAADFRPVRFCGCWRRGRVSVELRLRRRGYSGGEQIPYWLQVTNNSQSTLFNINVALLQHVTCRAGDKVKRITSTLAPQSKGDVKAGNTQVWDNERIEVPSGILLCSSTSRSTNRVITVKYTLTFSGQSSSWCAPFTLPVTLVLGSVALRPATIVTYLQLLGISGSGGPVSASPPTPHRPPSP